MFKPFLKLIIYSFLLFSYHNSYGQSFNFRHFTTEDGLPSSEVYHVFQDSKGYIWFATDNGVSRYDGYEFKNFTKEDGLPDMTVFEIYEDYRGRIWFIPHSAKFSYFINNSIYSYKFNDKLQEAFERSTNPYKGSFAIDSTERLFYGDIRNGAFIVDSTGNAIRGRKTFNYTALIDQEERIIVSRPIEAFEKKLTILKNGKEIFTSDANDTIVKSISKHAYNVFKVNDSIFIVSGKSVIIISNLGSVKILNLPSPGLYIYGDTNDNLWIGTRNGVLYYKNIASEANPKLHLLKNKNITSILQDKEGGIWITTLLDGVYYIPTLTTSNFKNDTILSKTIYSMNSQSDKLWFGLDDRVVNITSDNETKIYNLKDENIIIKEIYNDKTHNKVWILSRFLYSIKKGQVIKYVFKTFRNIKTTAQPKDLLVDNNGKVWVAASTGLYMLSKENYFKPVNNNINFKINSVCFSYINYDILCGSNNGLWKYSINSKTFSYLGNNNKLLSNHIDCMLKSSLQQNVWMGTKANGIIIYSKDTLYNITTKDGLSSNSITSLFQKNNIIWAATINGLNKIELNNLDNETDFKITVFDKMHGLTSDEIYDLYATDSIVYLATKKGLNQIRYRDIEPNKTPPNIYFKRIKIMDKDTTINNQYELPYYKNSLYIEYAGLMYRNNSKKRYKYVLQKAGEKSDWTETKDNFLRLSYLPPGNYSFKVIAINEDGFESINPAELSFKINPPFWKTWWFVSLVILILIMIIYLIFKSRINELNKRNTIERNLLKEVNKFRQQALSQQMNPHFIFNTLNSIQFFIYENDNDASVHYLSKFAKLMRTVLENSQHETITIKKELEALDLYLELEALRFEDGFNYEIKVSNEIDINLYLIYPLLIQPYVENSIWHGLYHKKGDKNLCIELINTKNNILCIIKDDGIGRAKSMEINKNKRKKHKSLGTKITNKRIDAINKLYQRNFSVDFVDLTDEYGIASGTKVLLKIPKISN